MKWVKVALLALLVLFVLAQLVRPSMANPPVDEAQTLYAAEPVPSNVRAILDRSCNDCHSNRTAWPWYARISPVSWFLADHVKDGRKELNFDAWGGYSRGGRRASSRRRANRSSGGRCRSSRIFACTPMRHFPTQIVRRFVTGPKPSARASLPRIPRP